jgi:phytoene dehydrogenase-like protein
VGNGFGFVVRHAMSGLPEYVAGSGSEGRDGGSGHLGADTGPASTVGERFAPEHRALQFVCPDLAYLERAYGDYLGGRPSRDPALISMTFSAIDDTLAPAGKPVMFLWGQYYPYELAGGERWADIGEREADRMLAVLDGYAPGTSDKVLGRLVETPVYLERELGLHRGNVMHLEMSLDQMFMLRPALTMGQYRGPLKGLYLTGASTHPGGGIMGAAGRNAAGVLLADWERGKLR